MVERNIFDSIEETLRLIREKNEQGMIISFGSHHDDNCGERGSVSVTIEKSGQSATSKALHLFDAYLLAAAKVERQIDAEIKRREKEKEQEAA